MERRRHSGTHGSVAQRKNRGPLPDCQANRRQGPAHARAIRARPRVGVQRMTALAFAPRRSLEATPKTRGREGKSSSRLSVARWFLNHKRLGNIRYAFRQFWRSAVIHGRDARATMASWHGRPGHDTKLDRFVNFVSTKWT